MRTAVICAALLISGFTTGPASAQPTAVDVSLTRVVEMPDGDDLLDYGLGLMKVSLPCGVTAWGHGGDIDGYHSFMAKTADGPAISVTFTQSPDASSPATDPRGDIMDALYCPA